MNEAARKARREYQKRYYQTHKERYKEYKERYWERKAEQAEQDELTRQECNRNGDAAKQAETALQGVAN